MERCAKGAFERAYMELKDPIQQWFLTQGVSHHDSENLVQDVFFILWERRSEVECQRTFLWGVARKRLRNYLRQQARLSFISLEPMRAVRCGPEKASESTNLDEQDILSIRQHRICKCMERLSPRQKDLVTLVHYQQISLNEAAASLHIKPTTAKTHMQRAMSSLKRFYFEELKTTD